MVAPRFHPFARLLIAVFGAIAVAIIAVPAIGFATNYMALIYVTLGLLQGGKMTISAQQISRYFTDNLLVTNLLLYPPVLLWLWFCRRFFDRRAFVSLGLRAKGFLGQFAGGIVCGFLTCAFTFAVLWLSGNLQVKGYSLAFESGGWSRAFPALCGWAAMMLCVGFMEEISFRGYAFHNLFAWLGARWAIAIQAAVFALIHLGNLAQMDTTKPGAVLAAWLAMPNIFLIGIFFAICYLKTGSLWFPIAFHAAWNFFLGCVFSLPVSGLPIFQLFEVHVSGSIPLTGGAFGPEASLLLTPILLASIFAASRASDHRQAIFDLESLRIGKAQIEIEAEIVEPTVETEAERDNRFRTRMGARQTEIDDQTRQTLRLLNETKTQREQSQSSTDPVENPVVQNPMISTLTGIEKSSPAEIIAAPIKVEEPAPAPPKGSTPSTDAPPPAGDKPVEKPKPPAPRW